MSTIPSGGSATINGILYQMLWSLLRAANLYIRDCSWDHSTQSVQGAQLKLEPFGGGGDLQETSSGIVIVQQLKTRSGDGTWSLRQVVEEVFPDLYKAIDITSPNIQYHFVTEGRMGQWEAVYSFFGSLGDRPCPKTDVLAVLDDSTELKFRRRKMTLHQKTVIDGGKDDWNRVHTERSLFELIAKGLRKSIPKAAKEPLDTTYRKLWHFLGRFTFKSGMTLDHVRREVDSILLSLIDSDQLLHEKRDAMLTGLARRASQGNAEVIPSQFLEEYRLDSVPLQDWACLRDRAHGYLNRQLERLGYSEQCDVRVDLASSILQGWSESVPILVLSGESGQGKSWCAFNMALTASTDKEMSIIIEASGDADNDLDQVAKVFWQEIKNSDGVLPLNRIAERRRILIHARAGRWLTLFIDGVQDPQEARKLARQPWDDWGVRVVITCAPEIANTIKQLASKRFHQVVIDDFTIPELQRYLATTMGDNWPDVPSAVRNTLRRPLLARLYRDLAEKGVWQPQNEYELYAECWKRLFEGDQTLHSLDVVCLKRLAKSLLDGATYPWTDVQLKHAGLDNGIVNRLCRIGWLRRTGTGLFEIWHDRLLNWAVAEGLVAAYQAKEIQVDTFVHHVVDCFSPGKAYNGRFLGYVPMDVVWLLSDPARNCQDALDVLIRTCEVGNWPIPHNLYILLPTVGSRIIPSLFRRLESVAVTENVVLPNQIVNAISSFDEAEVTQRATQFLQHSSRLVQRAGMSVLIRRPAIDAIDRLWELHCESEHDPTPFLRPHDSKYYVYEDSFGALRSCVQMNPNWLRQAIEKSDPATQPVETLAYLLANCRDAGDLWQQCKRTLFKKVKREKERCLATCIFTHHDTGEVDWLLERVDREDDLLGPAALRALSRVAPDRAIQELARLPQSHLGPTRHWCFDELFWKRTSDTRTRLLELLRQHSRPWELVSVYQDDENSMDAATLDFLLDKLEELLDTALSNPSDSTWGLLYIAFDIISGATRIELIECLERRVQTPLEEKLTSWLLSIGARTDLGTDRLERQPAMEVLYRIGGAGFTRVVNSWLRADNRYGRLDGLQLAAKRPDPDTMELLERIAGQDELWDGRPVEQGMAASALAACGCHHNALNALLKWGANLSTNLWSYSRHAEPLNDKTMRPVFGVLESSDQPSPGAILAIGIGGRKDYIDRVRCILREASVTPESALACILTLDHLGDSSLETESLLVKQLPESVT